MKTNCKEDTSCYASIDFKNSKLNAKESDVQYTSIVFGKKRVVKDISNDTNYSSIAFGKSKVLDNKSKSDRLSLDDNIDNTNNNVNYVSLAFGKKPALNKVCDKKDESVDLENKSDVNSSSLALSYRKALGDRLVAAKQPNLKDKKLVAYDKNNVPNTNKVTIPFQNKKIEDTAPTLPPRRGNGDKACKPLKLPQKHHSQCQTDFTNGRNQKLFRILVLGCVITGVINFIIWIPGVWINYNYKKPVNICLNVGKGESLITTEKPVNDANKFRGKNSRTNPTSRAVTSRSNFKGNRKNSLTKPSRRVFTLKPSRRVFTLKPSRRVFTLKLSRNLITTTVPLHSKEIITTATVYLYTKAQDTKSYGTGSEIMFSGVILSNGGIQSPDAGHYTCPENGIYYISITCIKTHSTNLNIKVMKGRVKVIECFDESSVNQWISITVSALVHCNKGELISLVGGGPGSVYGAHVAYSTFTGILLMQHTGHRKSLSVFSGRMKRFYTDRIYTDRNALQFSPDVFYPENKESQFFACKRDVIYFVSAHIYSEKDVDLVFQRMNSRYGTSEARIHIKKGKTGGFVGNSGLFYCTRDERMGLMPNALSFTLPYTSLHNSIPDSILNVFQVNDKHTAFIGASRYMTKSVNYKSGDKLIFDGNLLDPQHSTSNYRTQFKCKKAGVYFISVNLKQVQGKTVIVNVKMDRDVIFCLRHTIRHQSITLSHNALATCNAEILVRQLQEVCEEPTEIFVGPGSSIYLESGGSISVFGFPIQAHSTFTVFLLH